MGDTTLRDDDDAAPALPAWVESIFSDERAYWTALRDGGAITVEEGWEMAQREWGGNGPRV
ncbi:hypothetical protein [Tsukamurella pseudospumae]|uniref:Uncharacterized protein n=1 Tax=Tsukamurella pseudospumae TaxID=239498 RepID=A0A138ATW4_9ACTN|nr:hypothetical protein [Tsukamurella pseudospumae]KXP13891.1 hypothetical protein AXK60_22570 [Tsukamurella pseudospumae]